MIELIYQSRATKHFSYKELCSLLKEARKFNQDNQITGCLVYHEMTFIQLIEGKKDGIHNLYHRIARDTRHTNVSKVWESSIDQRGFSAWSMSLLDLSSPSLNNLFSDFLDSKTYHYEVKEIITSAKEIFSLLADNI